MRLTQLLLVFILVLASGNYLQAQDVIAEDNASNYTEAQFEALDNLGTGFGEWNRVISGDNADIFLQDASGNGENSAVINTQGQAFALMASETDVRGNRVDLGREFMSTLNDGDVLSFQFSWNWTDGIKGFTLYNGSWDAENSSLNIDFDPSGYYVNGDSVAAHATDEDWGGWRAGGVAFDVTVTRNGDNLDYMMSAITEESNVEFSGTVEGVNADRINFFNNDGPNWGGTGQGSILMNSLKITAGEATSNEAENIAKSFQLDQNYPNPFNPTTNISYTLEQSSTIQLSVYNMLGQEVRTLEQGFKTAGTHTVNFDASQLNSGMYMYQLRTEAGTVTRKMTLIK